MSARFPAWKYVFGPVKAGEEAMPIKATWTSFSVGFLYKAAGTYVAIDVGSCAGDAVSEAVVLVTLPLSNAVPVSLVALPSGVVLEIALDQMSIEARIWQERAALAQPLRVLGVRILCADDQERYVLGSLAVARPAVGALEAAPVWLAAWSGESAVLTESHWTALSLVSTALGPCASLAFELRDDRGAGRVAEVAVSQALRATAARVTAELVIAAPVLGAALCVRCDASDAGGGRIELRLNGPVPERWRVVGVRTSSEHPREDSLSPTHLHAEWGRWVSVLQAPRWPDDDWCSDPGRFVLHNNYREPLMDGRDLGLDVLLTTKGADTGRATGRTIATCTVSAGVVRRYLAAGDAVTVGVGPGVVLSVELDLCEGKDPELNVRVAGSLPRGISKVWLTGVRVGLEGAWRSPAA